MSTNEKTVKEKVSPDKLLKHILASETVPQFLWISSPEPLRRERALDSIRTKFALPSSKSIVASELDKQGFGRILDSLGAFSLFAEQITIFIKEIHKLENQFASALSKSLDNLPSSHPVTLIALGSPAKAAHPLLKFARSKHLAIEFDELDTQELTTWCKNELKYQGIERYDPNIPQLLATLSQANLELIANSLSQADLYLDGDTLTANTLAILFPASLDVTEFQFIDAVLDRQLTKAEMLLEKLLNNGASVFGIMALLQRNYQTFLSILEVSRTRISPDEAAKQLSMPSWLYKKQLARASRYNPLVVRRAMISLLKTDARLKNRSLSQQQEMSRLLGELIV